MHVSKKSLVHTSGRTGGEIYTSFEKRKDVVDNILQIGIIEAYFANVSLTNA